MKFCASIALKTKRTTDRAAHRTTLAPAQSGALFCPLFPETRTIYQGVGRYCAGSPRSRVWAGAATFLATRPWLRSGGAFFARPLSSEDRRDMSQVLPQSILPLGPALVVGLLFARNTAPPKPRHRTLIPGVAGCARNPSSGHSVSDVRFRADFVRFTSRSGRGRHPRQTSQCDP